MSIVILDSNLFVIFVVSYKSTTRNVSDTAAPVLMKWCNNAIHAYYGDLGIL